MKMILFSLSWKIMTGLFITPKIIISLQNFDKILSSLYPYIMAVLG